MSDTNITIFDHQVTLSLLVVCIYQKSADHRPCNIIASDASYRWTNDQGVPTRVILLDVYRCFLRDYKDNLLGNKVNKQNK